MIHCAALSESIRGTISTPSDRRGVADSRSWGLPFAPASAAQPSPTDAAEAFGDFLFVIVGLGAGPPEVTAWIWADGNFTAVPLVRVP